MASLNLSINGPSIKSSYQAVINATLPPACSPTYAHWALFSVQAPLVNAFQDGGAKESILKVESTGDGELAELVEDFNEGRIQFAFAKVKDANSGLPKCALVAWCGGGVPERTKGYFTSHLAAASKVLHGYHVQITARSEADVVPENIIQKIADASGAKYSAGSSGPVPALAPPPVASKPVFTPTSFGGPGRVNPIVAARSRKDIGVGDDGWGPDAPQVSRTQLEKVAPAYKPTKVDLPNILAQKQEPSKLQAAHAPDDCANDVVRGGYQPVGKINIAAIRAQAQQSQDDRPAPVKGAYEPIGKVDIAAIRAKAQPRSERPGSSHADLSEERNPVTSQQQDRINTLPKPKVAAKFGGSTFTGTKPPVPAALGFSGPSVQGPVPVGAASRNFADHRGKTPAQLWAEKKAKEKGSPAAVPSPSPAPAIIAQKSGSEWKSGYTGKSWAPVQAASYGRALPGDFTQAETGEPKKVDDAQDAPGSPAGGGFVLKDRFRNAQPIGTSTYHPSQTVDADRDHAQSTPAPSGGFALPSLPIRSAPEETPAQEKPDAIDERMSVPAPPVPEPVPAPEASQERHPSPPISVVQFEESQPGNKEPAVAQGAHSVAAAVASPNLATLAGPGQRAQAQFDYEKAEDNELELVAGEFVTEIEMVDADWWLGTNHKGERGLFPSNYVETVEDDAAYADNAEPEPEPESESEPQHAAVHPPPPPPPPTQSAARPTATALFDYEAAEDNEISFPEGATVTDLEFPDEDWWFGHYKGKPGLFPANYVQLDS